MGGQIRALQIDKLRGHCRKRVARGLWIQCTPRKDGKGHTKSWLLRYTFNGKSRAAGLGSYPAVSLADARRQASEWLSKLKGINPVDPLEERRTNLAAAKLGRERAERDSKHTFGFCARKWLDKQSAEWSNQKYQDQVSSQVTRFCRLIWDRRIGSLERADIVKVLEPLQSKPVTMKRLAMYCRLIIDHAIALDIRPAGANPADWNILRQLFVGPKLENVKHFAAIPWAELPAAWREVHALEGVAARGLELAMLTAVRTSNVLGARWKDVEGATWRIPRTKNRKPLDVPLSDAAMACIKRTPRINEYLFGGRIAGQPLGANALLTVLQELRPNVTVHGSTRTGFKSWSMDIGANPDAVEFSLGHAVGSDIERVYGSMATFTEMRRAIMDRWANFLTSPPADNVVPMIRSAAGG